MANSILLIALVLAATATIGGCQDFSSIVQARIRSTGLTCSEISPFPGAPILSGANGSVSCNGASNTTTTDATGSFSVDLSFLLPVDPLEVVLTCQVSLSPPPNCTRITGTLFAGLRTKFLLYEYPDFSVPGRRGLFGSPSFSGTFR